MPSISTARLIIKPTHKNCWSIFDRLDNQLIGKLFFRDQWFNILLKPQSLHYKAKTELPHAQQFLLNLGFTDQGGYFKVTAETLCHADLYTTLNQELGIKTNHLQHKKYATAAQLIDSDMDCFERSTKLHPQANQAWQLMKAAAATEDISIQLVSAFRSMSYQSQLIKNKLNKGQKINQILCTNTAPGHSEHHTGCAIDLTTEGFKPLEEEFEQSPAFTWLTTNAYKFGFVMSYPKDNPQGIIYEPWHWCYQHQKNLTPCQSLKSIDET